VRQRIHSPQGVWLCLVFHEAGSLPHLINRFAMLRGKYGVPTAVIIVDDDSRDVSDGAIIACGQEWVHVVVRTEDRGLS